MIAITISNRVNLLRFAEREARYLELAKRYNGDDLDRFCQNYGDVGCSFGR